MAACTAVFLAASPAAAVDVTTDADSGPGSLRQAVTDTPTGGTITIQPLPGPIVLASQIQVERDLTVAGQGMGATVVDGNDSVRPFLLAAAGFPHPTVTIRDLAITDGQAPPGEDGGGIRSLGTLTLERVAMTGNSAGSGGTGAGGEGIPGGRGGAIHASLLTVVDSILSGNSAGDGGAATTGPGGAGGRGGAINLTSSANVIRSTISGNFAGDGADSTAPGELGGAAGDGGGIASFADGLRLQESTVTNNSAGDAGPSGGSGVQGGQGGGVAGSATIRNSTIVGNQTGQGTGQSADGFGGGVWLGGSMISSTVTANRAGDSGTGSGISGGGSLDVTNSIVADNPGADCGGIFVDLGHNIGADPSCPAGFGGGDPLLDPAGLAANGGPTQTIRLLPGSAAIDAVPLATCTENPNVATPLTLDQRGFARPSGAACDAGAFETQEAATAPAPAAPAPAGSAPSNSFRFGKTKLNKRRGTATIIVSVPGPGALTLSGRGVVKLRAAPGARAPASEAIAAAGRVSLLVRPRGLKKRKLTRAGEVKVKVGVTYTPTGGTANTKTKKIRLKKRL